MDNSISNLGRRGKDKITGFKGTITSEHHYLTGCTQYGLVPDVKEDGSLGQTEYFDITRVEVYDDPIEVPDSQKHPGCDSRERP